MLESKRLIFSKVFDWSSAISMRKWWRTAPHWYWFIYFDIRVIDNVHYDSHPFIFMTWKLFSINSFLNLSAFLWISLFFFLLSFFSTYSISSSSSLSASILKKILLFSRELDIVDYGDIATKHRLQVRLQTSNLNSTIVRILSRKVKWNRGEESRVE